MNAIGTLTVDDHPLLREVANGGEVLQQFGAGLFDQLMETCHGVHLRRGLA